MRWLCLAWIGWTALVVAPCGASEGWIRTTDGQLLSGNIEFGTNGWTVRPPDGDAVQVLTEQLTELRLTNAPSAAGKSEPKTNAPPAEASTGTTDPWTPTAIGGVLIGSVTREDDLWRVSGAGAGLRGNADVFFLGGRRLESSGQILGELVSFDGTHPEAAAGLMLRDNTGEASAYAFVGQRAGSGVCFQYRQIAGGMTMRVTNLVQSLPAWLRLSRVGGAVVAEASADARQWQLLGKANVNLGQSVRAGMVLASGTETNVATAKFRSVIVGARGMGYVPDTGYPRLLLRNGSVVVAPIQSADESVLRLGGDFSGALISSLNLARIEFVPLTPELEGHLEPGRSGVLLADGDFFDGTLRGIATNTVTLGSLLFGYRRFSAGTEVAVVQLGTIEPEEAPFHIELRNGSMLRARRLDISPEGGRAESPLLGALAFGPGDLTRIERGAPAVSP